MTRIPMLCVTALVLGASTHAVAQTDDAQRLPAGIAVRDTPTVASPTYRKESAADPTLTRLGARIHRVSLGVRRLERIEQDLRVWFGCVSLVPVDQVGDRQHQWGFVYDERDGSGLDTRTALVRHTGSRRPDLALLSMSRRRACLSAAPDPNGTGDDAKMAPRQVRMAKAAGTAGATLPRLERRLERVGDRIQRLEDKFDRFDEWESCLSWLPVTEYGDEFQNLGFLFDERSDDGAIAPTEQQHLPALDIDSSEWDDPDYEFLAFLGKDRPFSRIECGHEPGEGVDKAAGDRQQLKRAGPGRHGQRADRLRDLRGDLVAAVEDVEDLQEPAQEFVQFDECMFTIGVQERGGSSYGYPYVGPDGRARYRSALSFDLSSRALPQFDLMGFAGEEPPQIECNEDAGGQDTDE